MVKLYTMYQGMALSLGDKINMMAKSPPPRPVPEEAAPRLDIPAFLDD
ncbi:hypothetical protein RR46_14564 [Papilio xuthus]|uniref:Uncharacterized protein n=1 Tax=Papilio xuthus TaxID=66420 RepID=A0A194PJ00_PAPXU|nr:hypothetical protein RR46_14564 [Papilio xuthus]